MLQRFGRISICEVGDVPCASYDTRVAFLNRMAHGVDGIRCAESKKRSMVLIFESLKFSYKQKIPRGTFCFASQMSVLYFYSPASSEGHFLRYRMKYPPKFSSIVLQFPCHCFVFTQKHSWNHILVRFSPPHHLQSIRI